MKCHYRKIWDSSNRHRG